MRTFKSMSEIKAANRQAGHCFFSRKTMTFHGSRIEGGVLRGRYFVTSEQPPHGPRRFSLRKAEDDGSIRTIGKHAGYIDRQDAKEALAELLK